MSCQWFDTLMWYHCNDFLFCRQKFQPHMSDILHGIGVSKDWLFYARPCPPRVLFVFESNNLDPMPPEIDTAGKMRMVVGFSKSMASTEVLPWIFLRAPLTFSEATRNIQGNLDRYVHRPISQRINSLRPSDAYMRHQPRPSLVQTIACCLFGT